MDNLQAMQVVNCLYDLPDNKSTLKFWQTFLPSHKLKQVLSRNILGDYVDVSFRMDRLLKSHDIRMVYDSHDLTFIADYFSRVLC